MKKNINKIILGGAQISSIKYGLTNKLLLKKDELNRIIHFAKKNKINFIDTAKSYKNSEVIIGKFNRKFNIITKIQTYSNDKNNSEKYIKNALKDSLKKLKVKKLYAVLIHGVGKLSNTKLLKIINVLKKLQKQNKIKYIGISIYDPKDLKVFWKDWKPDIIQVQYNIFDRRIKTSGWLKKFKNHKIKVHIRSIFLQGLLITPKLKYPKKLNKLKKLLNYWFVWCKNNNRDPMQECLRFSLRANIDKIIVGVYSLNQLKNLVESFKSLEMKSAHFPVRKYNRLVDPREWN